MSAVETLDVSVVTNPDRKQALADFVYVCIGLRDFDLMAASYPDVAASADCIALRRRLEESLERSFVASGIPDVIHLGGDPAELQRERISETFVFGTFAMAKLAAEMKLATEKEFYEKSETLALEVYNAAVSQVSSSLRPDLEFLEEIRLYDCRIPHASDSVDFASKKRLLHVLQIYLGLISEFLLSEAQALGSFSPHPLLRLYTNLKKRIEECLSLLNNDKLSKVIDPLLDLPVMDVDVMDDWLGEQLNSTWTMIELENLELGLGRFDLTQEELLFIKTFEERQKQYRAMVKTYWKKLEDKIAVGRQGTKLSFSQYDKNTSLNGLHRSVPDLPRFSGQLSTEDRTLFELFCERADRLAKHTALTARLNLTLHIAVSEPRSLGFSEVSFSEESFKSLATSVRQFYMKREAINFQQIRERAYSYVKDGQVEVRTQLELVNVEFDNALQVPLISHLHIGQSAKKPAELLDLWFNAEVFHCDLNKLREWTQLNNAEFVEYYKFQLGACLLGTTRSILSLSEILRRCYL